MANTLLSDFLTKTGSINRPSLTDPANSNSVVSENDYTVNNNTRVNIGSSPNANDGDPLRTAFQKLNNFIEAVYRVNVNVNTDISTLSSAGTFLGAKNYVEITGLSPNSNDTIVLDKPITTTNPDLTPVYTTFITIESFTLANGLYTIAGGSFLKYNSTKAKFELDHNNAGSNVTFDFDGAVARLAQGLASSTLTSLEQQQLYSEFQKLNQGAANSKRIQATTIEDAITELTVKSSTSGRDAGYYA
tara:strand:+ start:26444 stop:27181 length:738 start_codon:yes stop_codon:yes gene_type:complete